MTAEAKMAAIGWATDEGMGIVGLSVDGYTSPKSQDMWREPTSTRACFPRAPWPAFFGPFDAPYLRPVRGLLRSAPRNRASRLPADTGSSSKSHQDNSASWADMSGSILLHSKAPEVEFPGTGDHSELLLAAEVRGEKGAMQVTIDYISFGDNAPDVNPASRLTVEIRLYLPHIHQCIVDRGFPSAVSRWPRELVRQQRR
jgi:hypothetical protein